MCYRNVFSLIEPKELPCLDRWPALSFVRSHDCNMGQQQGHQLITKVQIN